MKRTDEMKLGENLRAPDHSPERLAANAEELLARTDAFPQRLNGAEYWCGVAMRRGLQLSDQCIEIDALKWKVQISQGLTLVGWAAVILLALGV